MTELTTNPTFAPPRPTIRPMARLLNVLATAAVLAGLLAAV
jgi:hypothetical protein